MNNTNIKNSIKYFIKNKVGIRVDDNTVFFNDLDMKGDDADYFLERFSKEFDVDFTSFEFTEYFNEEFSTLFFWRNNIEKKVFKLDHLVEVVKKGYWFDPMI